MIRRPTRFARLLSVATGPLILCGCATRTVVFDTDASRGAITSRPGRPGSVIAAPHGTSDVRTGDIAADLAQRTGFGVVIATGFSIEPDTRARAGRRYQVNRPMELPKAARTEWREVYTAVLADFLLQAAADDPGR